MQVSKDEEVLLIGEFRLLFKKFQEQSEFTLQIENAQSKWGDYNERIVAMDCGLNQWSLNNFLFLF